MNKITEERKDTLGMRGGQRVVWYAKAQNEEETPVKAELERKTGRVRTETALYVVPRSLKLMLNNREPLEIMVEEKVMSRECFRRAPQIPMHEAS